MSKKGILVVSFGTSHMDTKEKTIDYIEKRIGDAFSEYKLYEAFTSGMIINVLKKRDNMHIFTVEEALLKMKEDGMTDIIVQPTHILNGIENDFMIEDVRRHRDAFDSVVVGSPLLTDTEDYFTVIDGLMADMPKLEDGECILFMGHGSDHYINATYPAINYMFADRGYEHCYVGCVEAYPTIEDIMAAMNKKGYKKVYLTPFMIVAGEHTKNDMIGEEEDSWINQLTAAGFEVEPIVKGIGEYEFIADLLIEHAKAAK